MNDFSQPFEIEKILLLLNTYKKISLIPLHINEKDATELKLSFMSMNLLITSYGDYVKTDPMDLLEEMNSFTHTFSGYEYLLFKIAQYTKFFFNPNQNSINSNYLDSNTTKISFEQDGIIYKTKTNEKNKDMCAVMVKLVNEALMNKNINNPKLYRIPLTSASNGLILLSQDDFNFLYDNRLLLFTDYKYIEYEDWWENRT